MTCSLPCNGQVSVRLLGRFRVEIDGQLLNLPTQRVEALFAYLLLHPNRHTREKLAELFWGHSPRAEALVSLRQALASLRRCISAEIILANRECVGINPGSSLWVDVVAFQAQARQFLAGAEAPVEQINMELYQGELLYGFDGEWILPLRIHYHTLYIDVLLRAIERLRSQSEYSLAIDYAQRILQIDPSNERAHQHMMFCHVTLGDRTRALQQYAACQRALLEELDVEPAGETRALYQWIKEADTPISSQAARITNLPIPISSFVGRSAESAQIKQLLTSTRLVSLIGPGGIGKTRLAIHIATGLIDSYKDGVWWVDFSPVSDASLIPNTIAKALGITVGPQLPIVESISVFVQKRQLLLVLDNCEHLLAAIAQLAEHLLCASPSLRILTTSREALGMLGEHVWHVSTLTIPETNPFSLTDLLMEYEGIRLFFERARAVREDFVLSDAGALSIAQICRHLDGIPLAIELAAARMKVLSTEQIADRLDHRFDLLTIGNRTADIRHQTLRATIDWSYDLLTEAERLLFARLSVFAGGWTIESAEAVCSGDGLEPSRMIDLLAHLLDKSMITFEGGGQRYDMLETIKAYAKEKLDQSQAQTSIGQRHVDYFLSLAELADQKIRGPEQISWLKRLDTEHDNLTLALEWALNNPTCAEKGILLACVLTWYWGMVGDFVTERYWLEKALLASATQGRTISRAKILFSASAMSCWGLYWLDGVEAHRLIEESLDIWRELGSGFDFERAQCLLVSGLIQKTNFNNDQGFKLVRESIEIFKATNHPWWQAWALNISAMMYVDFPIETIRQIMEEESVLLRKIGDKHELARLAMDFGTLALSQGDFHEAEKHLQECLALFKQLGSKGNLFQLFRLLGIVNLGLMRYQEAKQFYKESIPYAQQIGWYRSLAGVYCGLGLVALRQGEIAQAERWFNQALETAREFSMKPALILCTAGFAALAASQNNQLDAVRLFGAYRTQQETLEPRAWYDQSNGGPAEQKEFEHYLALCRQNLDDVTFNQSWREGCALSLEHITAKLLLGG